MSTIVDALKTAAKAVTKGSKEITSAVADLRRQLAEKQAQLRALQRAPLPIDDVRVLARKEIARIGELYLRDTDLVYRLTAPSVDVFENRGARIRLIPSDPVPWGLLCAGDPARAEELVVALVERAGLDAGAPAAERPALIEKLKAELTEIGQAEEQLVDQAAEAGVTIEHRPDVARRRAERAAREQARQTEIAEREERQRALDKRHPQPRAAQSSYVTGEQGRDKFA